MTSAMPVSALPRARADAVRLRDAPHLGLTRAQLRSTGWQQLSHGLHAVRRPERPLVDTARLVAQVLPRDSGFGHLTSAALRGWWLPHVLPAHVLLATTTSQIHVQRGGLYVRRSRTAQIEMVDGVPCVSASDTLAEMARDLSLIDLVPMIDCALATGESVESILSAIRPGARGARVLRRAVKLADAKSESWWETVLRLQHTLVGLGPVECQHEIWDGKTFVARADLYLVGTHRFPECDGGDHRDRDRHGRDLRRDKALLRLGLDRYGYTTAEIAREPGTVIRDAEAARGLVADPARVARWWALARPSSITAYGRSRLGARLESYRLATRHRVAEPGRR